MRLRFVDGLRGIAAGTVVLYHLVGRTDPELPSRFGYLGVAVFFVLSGYVITMVVGDNKSSWKFLGHFALRRSLRLDPPYWASIATALVLMLIASRLGVAKDLPSVNDVVLHMFYLQDLVGVEPISPIYWTLCYEIQFYIALILLRWTPWPVVLTAALGVLSLFSHAGFVSMPRGLFVPSWYCFALGALAYWTSIGRLKPLYFASATTVVVAFHDAWSITAGFTAAALFAAHYFDKMQGWLSGAVWQFFGRISYSLYLFHPLVGWSAQSLALRYANQWVALVIGLVVSVLSAWAAYHLVERPAIVLSHWATRPRAMGVAVPSANG